MARSPTRRPRPQPSADGRKVRGDRTRRAILRAAVNIASVEGLEGLTIGRLATELEMSKSGLFAHFGSKEELQISTVRAAAAIFVAARDPRRRGAPRARASRGCAAVLDSWLDYMERGTFAGGCFFAAATIEMDGRPGPVRDAVAAQMSQLGGAARRLLARCDRARRARRRHGSRAARVRARRARHGRQLRLAAARGRRRVRARPARDRRVGWRPPRPRPAGPRSADRP